MRNVIIIGSGPAGLTAALYTARANLEPLVVAGAQPGGQLTITSEVENYPGFPEGIDGPTLMDRMRKQAERFGAEFLTGEVNHVDFGRTPLAVTVEERTYESRTVIIASGSRPRMLGLESEQKAYGRGVSTCATCDGFFFRGQEIAVVGGGDSAAEEAIFLTKFASKVTLIHRRDELRASKIMQDRIFENEKVKFQWDSVVDEVLLTEDGGVKGVRLKHITTGETKEIPVTGLFIAIGHIPNTQVFQDQIDLDEAGYIRTVGGTRTNIEGVFAAGDIMDHVYRQAVTAAGAGCKAAIDVERYLLEHA